MIGPSLPTGPRLKLRRLGTGRYETLDGSHVIYRRDDDAWLVWEIASRQPDVSYLVGVVSSLGWNRLKLARADLADWIDEHTADG